MVWKWIQHIRIDFTNLHGFLGNGMHAQTVDAQLLSLLLQEQGCANEVLVQFLPCIVQTIVSELSSALGNFLSDWKPMGILYSSNLGVNYLYRQLKFT